MATEQIAPPLATMAPPTPFDPQQFARRYGGEFTKWRNPTDSTLRVELFFRPGEKYLATFAPGAELELPTEFDNAIHEYKRNAYGEPMQIVAGLAPQLVRADGTSPPLHPALITPATPKKRR